MIIIFIPIVLLGAYLLAIILRKIVPNPKRILVTLAVLSGVPFIISLFHGDIFDWLNTTLTGILLLGIFLRFKKINPVSIILIAMLLAHTHIAALNRIIGYPDKVWSAIEGLSLIFSFAIIFVIPFLKSSFRHAKQWILTGVCLALFSFVPLWILPGSLLRNMVGLQTLSHQLGEKYNNPFISIYSKNEIIVVVDWDKSPASDKKVLVFNRDMSNQYKLTKEVWVLDNSGGTMENQQINLPFSKLIKIIF